MKRTIFITLTILFINQSILIAQQSEPKLIGHKIGITFSSFGENDVFRFDELDGAASYDRDYFFTIGINYLYPLNNWMEAETGIEYSKHTILIEPNLPPDMDNSQRKANFSLIIIPLTLRANFLKYIFVNGGLFLDIDASTNSPIDSQTGIGTVLGLSVKYDFKNGVTTFINPYTKIHSLIPFADSEYHQRIWENGIRVGITYNLKMK
ncbi:MAG: hypothetical protein JXQ65_06725 [Candidatus Marinimicrobia bacterium]|nr:hypothetical protein [Candidatus Neomarinimicrobiota bacterium]